MPHPLSITYLVEEAEHAWGGVQTVFREADALVARGHDVRIYCKTGRPSWYEAEAEVIACDDFDELGPCDVVVGTWCTTVRAAWKSPWGIPVHYCQGYEGDDVRFFDQLWLIEHVYDLPGMRHIAIAPFLGERLAKRFGIEASVVPYGVQDQLFRPAERATPHAFAEPGVLQPVERKRRFRVGLVGPWECGWKDLATGVRSTRRAQELGLDVELVRISSQPICDDERRAWGELAVETHIDVRLEDMPGLYQSLDVFLGTSSGGGEGFFLPAIEAMACGVPCILSDIRCFKSYADATDYARFFDVGDSEQLAAEIVELAHNRVERQRLIERGAATAKLHGFQAHVDAIEALFCEYVPREASIANGASGRRRLDLPQRRAVAQEELLSVAQELCGEAFEEAMQLARACTIAFPEATHAWALLARMHADIGKLDEAATFAERALEHAPQSIASRDLLARIELLRNNAARAHECWNYVLEEGPADLARGLSSVS